MTLADDAKRPVPARKPLLDNPRRKYGSARAPLVQCSNAKHGAYPSNESCPDCLSWSESHAELPGPCDLDDEYPYPDHGYAWADGMWP